MFLPEHRCTWSGLPQNRVSTDAEVFSFDGKPKASAIQ
jgi:hypothetical protein